MLLWLLLKGIITKKNESEYNISKNITVMYLGRVMGLIVFSIGSYFARIAVSKGFISNPDLVFTVMMYTMIPTVASLVAKVIVATVLNSVLED